MRSFAVLLIAALPLAGCGEPPAKTASVPPAVIPDSVDPQLVARGAKIYQANCVGCHGTNAEGAPNWHKQGPDGKYPAPPLNGTGHDWHHPTSALKWTIREGTAKLGGNMPAWKGKLPDSDIDAVIAWFQSLWPEEVYKNWVLIDAKARRGSAQH